MQFNRNKYIFLGVILLVAAITRLIPHPMNLAPLGAMALFSSAYMRKNQGMGLGLTMGAWFVSDFILNNFVYGAQTGIVMFTEGALFIYGSIALIFLVGRVLLKKITVGRMVGGSLLASVIFFIVSNLGVWMQGFMYPMTLDGLIACYNAALPFFQNTVTGDLLYSGLLFVIYEKLFRQQLEESKVKS